MLDNLGLTYLVGAKLLCTGNSQQFGIFRLNRKISFRSGRYNYRGHDVARMPQSLSTRGFINASSSAITRPPHRIPYSRRYYYQTNVRLKQGDPVTPTREERTASSMH